MLTKILGRSLCLCSAILLVACGSGHESKLVTTPHSSSLTVNDARTLMITDLNGQPISGAQILIGTQMGQPFAGNFVNADSNGTFQAPAAWTIVTAVTIQAPGYVRTTFLQQVPSGQNFQLHRAPSDTTYHLSGTVNGFSPVNYDGKVDFGLVMPGLTKQDFFSFNVGLLLSPQQDQISLLGKTVELPSNLTLPTQKESYYLPFTLEKPSYRMSFQNPGPQKVVVLRGQFPLNEVVAGIQNGQTMDSMVNLLSIQGGSIGTVNITDTRSSVNLPANQMTFTQTRNMQAPQFQEQQEVVFGLGIAQDGNINYPTDIKTLGSGELTALHISAANMSFGTVKKRRSEIVADNLNDRVTAAFLPFTNNAQAQLLPLMENPVFQNGQVLQIPLVQGQSGVAPTATYATLWAVGEVGEGDKKIESLHTQWEIYAPGWVRSLPLPAWPGAQTQNGKMRWGVTLLGQSMKVSDVTLMGPAALETATHATHASVDF